MKTIWKLALAVATVALVQMAVPTFADAAGVGGIKKTPPITNPGSCGGLPCSALVISAGTGGTGIPWETNGVFSFQLTKQMLSGISGSPSFLMAFDNTSQTQILFETLAFVDTVPTPTFSSNLAMDSGVTYDLGYYLQPASPLEYQSFVGNGPQFVHLQFLTFDMPDFVETVTQAGVAPVPEPSTILLLGIGIAGIAGSRRIRQRMKKSIC